MKKTYFTLIYLFFTSFLFSQKETNTWIFGFGNEINFNIDPPVSGFSNNFNFFAERNTVSISDQFGALLFSSDGFLVYDKDHNPMPNGFINADFSVSHPVFAIPKPGSLEKYILIVNSLGFANAFMEWFEIDMSLNNNLGDMIFNGNQILLDNSTGKTTAIQHANFDDIWIIGHESNSDKYLAWLVDANGVSNDPVESAIGSFIDSNNFSNNLGQIKTSLSGNKIAAANQGLNNVEIFDFDKNTGQLSNLIQLDVVNFPYGVEFSPSERYLYVSQFDNNNAPQVAQFDLWAGNEIDIENSMIFIGGTAINFGGPGALQLASNGKIYTVNAFDFIIGAINHPDLANTAADYDPFAIELLFSETLFGLPSFYHAYFQSPYFNYAEVCPGDATEFTIDGFENQIDSVLWDFGDPSSGANNFSTALNPTHIFPGSGSYEVQLTVYSGPQTYVNENLVHIAPTSIDLGDDQTICSNELLVISPNVPNANYEWSTGATTSSIEVDSPGTYSVEIFVEDCPVLSDEITINHLFAPNADLGGDGGLCNGDEAVLDVTHPNSTYQWSTGATTSSIAVLFSGTYAVTVTSANGCTDSDMVFYQFDQVTVNPTQANLACHGDSSGVALVFPVTGVLPFSFAWDNGDTLYTRNGMAAGDYSLTITDALGCTTSQEFTLTEPPEIMVDVVVNADDPGTSNPDGQILLQPTGGVPPFIFDWADIGESDNPLRVGLSDGIYTVTVKDDNDCEKILEVIVGNGNATEELIFLEKTQLFPNPTNELLFIKIPNAVTDDLAISISSVLGQQVIENYFLEKGKKEFEINVSDWPSGIYFIKIKIKAEEKIWKVNVFK